MKKVKNIKDIATKILIILIIAVLVLIVIGIVRKFAPSAAVQSDSGTGTGQGEERAGGGGRSGGGSGSGGQRAGQGEERGSGGGRSGDGGGGRRAGTAVRITPVALGTIENSVILNGDVLTSSQVTIFPAMAGTITEMRVGNGDRINRGQVIAMVDPSRPGDPFYPSPVLSTVSGVVMSVPVSRGDTVNTNSVICVVGNLGDLRVETHVPERYSVTMRRGLPAQVSFEAMPGEIFAAEIDELSPVLDPASRTLRIRLRILPDSGGRVDPRILAGMFATVSLVTNSRTDVPVIPREALINTYGTWIVFILPESSSGADRAKRREVTLGLESETMVEILTGLKAGEMVVTEGQNFLADGDPVQIVE